MAGGGGGGGGPAGSGSVHVVGGGGNTGDSSDSGSTGGGGGRISDDVIASPFDIGDMPFIELLMTPLHDDVMEGGGGGAGGAMGGLARVEGGAGGMCSEGAPSGLRCASVCDLLSSFISAANTCSNWG